MIHVNLQIFFQIELLSSHGIQDSVFDSQHSVQEHEFLELYSSSNRIEPCWDRYQSSSCSQYRQESFQSTY
jgi:hypothetical protein